MTRIKIGNNTAPKHPKRPYMYHLYLSIAQAKRQCVLLNEVGVHRTCFLIWRWLIKNHIIPPKIRKSGKAPNSSSTVIINTNNTVPNATVIREKVLFHLCFGLISPLFCVAMVICV